MLSTDAAHSLADAFGVARRRASPTEVAPDLFVQQVDAQRRFEQSWAEIQGYLLSVLEVAGVDPVAAEELTVIPGRRGGARPARAAAARARRTSGTWSSSTARPTAETLRLLALPEALGWYMTRVFPVERRVVKALRPVLTRAAGVPMPEDDVFDAVERLHAELDEVRALLTGPDASVRLVLTPEQVVLAEARRELHDAVAVRLPRRRRRRQPGLPRRRRATRGAPAGCAAQAEVLAEVGAVVRRAAGLALGVPADASRSGCRALEACGRAAVRRRRPARRTAGRAEPLRITRTRDGRRAAAARCRSSTAATSTWRGTATSWS